ncbi:cell wall hydrolase [Sphingomonas oligophenolica]|uniref:Cell wall hydrolase n=2 Tax=Sphingomonas oligophenolica TaxID=301154 RepID=A0A502CS93_9SPHN|nr:cell wall hydrolase [Sphingomonas oligophenolica]TPG15713.1 cell wall hydrolase [Sphingomonas oligophenolica]
MTLSWAILVLAGLALVGGLSAHAAWRAVETQAARAGDPSASVRTGYEAEDHFPGAALLYADFPVVDPSREIAAPAAGVTGTTALPDLPIPANAAAFAATDMGVVAARPFSIAAASSLARSRAAECLTAAIYYEAATEPDAGQSAVAQVILNRVRHPAFPSTICGVVYQGSERAGCQFSFACDGAMARVPMRSAWTRAARAAAMALAGYVYAPVGLATHYHTYAVTPAWNRSLVMTGVVGAHFFHRWKGFWGTAAAFSQRYTGNEPVPGPHARTAPTPAPFDAKLYAALAPLPTPAPITNAAQVTPAYADSGSYVAPPPPIAGAKPKDNLPPASQILDKWKDSGKPLF